MQFVQIVSYTTDRRDELEAEQSEWLEDTEGVRTVRRRVVLKDRDVENRYVEVVFFDSYEAAMHNSMLPATSTVRERVAALTQGGFNYQNLVVLSDETL